jgi:geranylgeranyl pyrophosphate synthase
MASEIAPSLDQPAEGIKHVPQDTATRQAIRSAAAEAGRAMDRSRPPSREDLQRHGEAILQRLDLPGQFLGFVMVAVSNEFWRPIFEAIPLARRLFLLPHCLSDRTACTGTYDSVGLHCAGCGNCAVDSLQREAVGRGYSVIVAEGTGSVLTKILEGEADAIFGVACLDSLEKSFHRVAELGVPHMALPLLKNGCVDTTAELDQIHLILAAETAPSEASPRSYVPLLRETTRMFRQPMFSELLALGDEPAEPAADTAGGWSLGEEAAQHWLREGGKRLRPFVTIAAYAVARHGAAVLDSADLPGDTIPSPVRRLALAIEALHKASLVHDDIEDDDEFRYGRPTLHRVHGVGQAINMGDYLIGLGYRLIAAETGSLGADCVADILNRLSRAHVELCRGQGAELLGQTRPQKQPRPMDVLTAYALKTAPAFEVAIYTGLRAASVKMDLGALRRFSTFLGEGFQIRNDLDDWNEGDHNKRRSGLDALAGRPTILRAFAMETMWAQSLVELAPRNGHQPPPDLVEQVRDLYCRCGAFARAERLLEKLRARALETVGGFPSADLQELMRFLVRMILPEAASSEVAAR